MKTAMKTAMSEHLAAWTSMLMGVMICAAAAPHDAFFLPNFCFYWRGQGAVIATLCLGRARMAALAGASLAMTLLFLCFYAWVSSAAHPQGMAWLLYLCALPGPIVACAVLTAFWGAQAHRTPAQAGAIVAAVVAASAVLNFAGICWSA